MEIFPPVEAVYRQPQGVMPILPRERPGAWPRSGLRLIVAAFDGLPGRWLTRTFADHGDQILWGAVVGLAILSPAGQARVGSRITASTSSRWSPTASRHRPARRLLFLMTAGNEAMSFSIGSVFGVVLGALIGSISKGHFRWEACDDPGELGRQIMGGALMGVGGVLAVGCSVGQGLTAFSTLAYSAPVVLGAIFLGAASRSATADPGVRGGLKGRKPSG